MTQPTLESIFLAIAEKDLNRSADARPNGAPNARHGASNAGPPAAPVAPCSATGAADEGRPFSANYSSDGITVSSVQVIEVDSAAGGAIEGLEAAERRMEDAAAARDAAMARAVELAVAANQAQQDADAEAAAARKLRI